MTEDEVELPLSRQALLVLHSAANEATIFYADDRAASGAPTEDEAELMSNALDKLLRSQDQAPYLWALPVSLVTQARALIPACLAVHDPEELLIRTMESVESFCAAQAELIGLLEAEGYTA